MGTFHNDSCLYIQTVFTFCSHCATQYDHTVATERIAKGHDHNYNHNGVDLEI